MGTKPPGDGDRSLGCRGHMPGRTWSSCLTVGITSSTTWQPHGEGLGTAS